MILNDIIFVLVLSYFFGWQGAIAAGLALAMLWYGAQGVYFLYYHLLRKLAV